MHIDLESLRHSYRWRQRYGIAAIEFAVVLCFILLGSLVALYALSSYTNLGFQSVATLMAKASPQDTVANSKSSSRGTESTTSIEPLLDRQKAENRTADMAVVICLFCTIVIGFLYLRLWQKRRGDLRKRDEEVREINERSLALRQVLSKRNSIFNRIDENWETILSGHAKVETYMSSNVVSVDPLMAKSEALFDMQEQGFRRFMVCRKDGTFAGVVSRKDILSQPGERVCDVMTDRPRMATPETEIQTALSILLENRISCLPVVKDRMLVGLLSVSDLLMVLQCLLRDLSTRDIDPAFVEAQSLHDRCQLLPESDSRQSDIRETRPPSTPVVS